MASWLVSELRSSKYFDVMMNGTLTGKDIPRLAERNTYLRNVLHITDAKEAEDIRMRFLKLFIFGEKSC